jgi:thiol-disulfide isomerase/thioredoxin/uncharacterized membrane protein YphA (DoxX/SURF4 family)
MGPFVFGSRVILAAVFGLAAWSKLRDIAGSRQALTRFGLPGSLAAPLGVVFPVVECAVALLVLFPASARMGAVAVLGLLTIFSIAMVVNLALGRRPSCACFGQLSSGPIGWSNLVRNGGLGMLAGLVALEGPGPSAWAAFAGLAAMGGQGALFLVAATLLALFGTVSWLVLHLLDRYGRVLQRLERIEASVLERGVLTAPPLGGLPVGTRAPQFALADVRTRAVVTLRSLCAKGNLVLLVFLAPNCPPCKALLPELGRWQRANPEKVTLVLISRGGRRPNESLFAEYPLGTIVLLEKGHKIARAYQANGTPTAVVVSPDGTVARPAAGGAYAIRTMLESLLERRAVDEPMQEVITVR